MVSLTLATSLATGSSYANAAVVFSLVFVVLWVGAIVVSVNAQLLGGKLSLPQSVCIRLQRVPGLRRSVDHRRRRDHGRRVAARAVCNGGGCFGLGDARVRAVRRGGHPFQTAGARGVPGLFLFYSWLSWMVVVV